MTDNRKDLVAAGLISLAEAIVAGVHPVPNSIDLWQHRVTAQQLLTLADVHNVKIIICRDSAGTAAQADVRIPLGAPEADMTWIAICQEVTPGRISAYEKHNAECIIYSENPCAGGKCPDPIMHAEGGHDI